MTVALDRRDFVAASLAQAMAFALGGSAHGQAGAGHDGLVLGHAQPFSFDALKERAIRSNCACSCGSKIKC